MSHLKNFQKELSDAGFDAAIVSSELNQRYLSGFNYTDGYVLVTPAAAWLLADFRYTEAAEMQLDKSEFTLVEPKGMLSGLLKIMKDNGISKVAVEEDTLSIAMFEEMKESFGGEIALVVGASKILNKIRAIKDEEELSKMARAQEITDRAFEHILGFINPDRTEIEVALELEFYMKKLGAEGLAFETIAVSGDASSLPHGVPRDVKLKKGFFTMDFGAKFDGYCADMTRTVVIGKADEDIKKVYGTVLSAQTAVLDVLGEGMLCREADKIARDIIYGAGYEGCFGHGLGHSVGMFIHEDPRVSPKAGECDRLMRGHVVTIEPGIYLAGKYGCRIEDMVAINLDGKLLNFTKSPKNLIEL